MNYRNHREFDNLRNIANTSNNIQLSPEKCSTYFELRTKNSSTTSESYLKRSSWFVRINSNDADENEDEDEDEDVLGITYGIFWLLIVTIFISILSDMLVETIEPAAASSGMSNVFLSAIVIPIIGNATEHASAVVFGLKNKLDLSLAITIGSATQIAVFLIPLIVIIGWIINVPMSWNLQIYEVASLLLAVLLVGYIVQTGTSTWLDGVVLIGGYIIVSGAYWAHVNESDIHE